MKPSRLQEHLAKIYGDKKDKNLSYFRTLKEKFSQQPTVAKHFSNATSQDSDGLLAFYNISLMIAKSGQTHAICEELIIPAVREVIRTALQKPSFYII